MNKRRVVYWARKDLPRRQEKDFEVRLTLILRALFEADDRGILPLLSAYKVRQYTGVGKVKAARMLADLRKCGFLRDGDKLTEIAPYRECMEDAAHGLSQAPSRGDTKITKYFSAGDQPVRARDAGPVQQGGRGGRDRVPPP